jgi:GNAT superfamily N-acetyltransferase
MVTRAGPPGTIRAVTDKSAARQVSEEAARYRVAVGDGVPELDQRLSDELDLVNAKATAGLAPARELRVQVLDNEGNLAAGMSGWTWGVAAGIGMTWVREDTRGAGLGTTLLHEFEAEARMRGCTHVFVTSFTFQAPGFYERHGYREIFRWDGVPVDGAADVHFRKDL